MKTKKFASVSSASAKGSTKAAKKSSKKSRGGPAGSRSANVVVTFKKAAKEDSLPAQAETILSVIKSKGTSSLDKIFTALDGKLATKQPIPHIWAFYRKQLIDGGFISVAAAKQAA